MDEEEFETDDDGLDIGASVIVTTDEGYEIGTLLGSTIVGVRLSVTHKVERVQKTVSEKDAARLEAAIETLTRRELISYAFMAGHRLAFLKNLQQLRELCLYEAIADEEKHLPQVDMLRSLTRPVSTFVPMDRIQKIQSLTEYDEEQMLSRLEFSVEV